MGELLDNHQRQRAFSEVSLAIEHQREGLNADAPFSLAAVLCSASRVCRILGIHRYVMKAQESKRRACESGEQTSQS